MEIARAAAAVISGAVGVVEVGRGMGASRAFGSANRGGRTIIGVEMGSVGGGEGAGASVKGK